LRSGGSSGGGGGAAARRPLTLAPVLALMLVALARGACAARARDAEAALAAPVPSYVLPLASPIGDPSRTFIPPWTFGNHAWDPVAGGPAPFGPSPDYKNSLLPPGVTEPFPPGTPPEANPNMYIQPAPTGVNTGVNPATLMRFKDRRLNAKGQEVGEAKKKQMMYNMFPPEWPFNTNGPWARVDDATAGLPLLVNKPELDHVRVVPSPPGLLELDARASAP
jgi:hypothetical protein